MTSSNTNDWSGLRLTRLGLGWARFGWVLGQNPDSTTTTNATRSPSILATNGPLRDLLVHTSTRTTERYAPSAETLEAIIRALA